MGNLVTETPYSEITATLEVLDRCGVTCEDLKNFRKASSFVHFEVARLMKNGEVHGALPLPTFRVTVDYDKTVESLVKAGKYDYANSDITAQHFSTQRSGIVQIELHLLHFNRSISSDDVIKEMDKLGLRPAKPHELLTFGIQYPDEQRKYPIVALGSVWRRFDGDRCVLGLWGDSGDRDLGLPWWDGDWRSDYRFAAVRK